MVRVCTRQPGLARGAATNPIPVEEQMIFSESPQENRIPEKGDRVTTPGLPGMFTVLNVYDSPSRVVDLKLIGPTEHVEKQIPWGVLIFLDPSDETVG
jgi:hypothetical protein